MAKKNWFAGLAGLAAAGAAGLAGAGNYFVNSALKAGRETKTVFKGGSIAPEGDTPALRAIRDNLAASGPALEAWEARKAPEQVWIKAREGFDLAAYYAACAALEVHSPSKKGDFLGEMFDLGLAGGIMDNADEVEDAVDFLNDLAAADVDDVNARVAVNGRPQGGSETDYDRIKAAFVEAIEETGLGDMVMAVDGRILGETVEPYSSRATRQRQQQTVKGRTSRLVMG
jgi:hypothetical protein